MSDPGSAAAQVEANARVFARLVGVVRGRVASGRLDSAAAWARVAAAFATTNPCGALCDVGLEELLDEISRAALPPVARAPRPVEGGRRVLHVVSEANHLGGHVRMMLRWIESDAASVPSAVVTRPGCGSPELAEAVARRGGSSTELDSGSLVDRARRLRASAAAADFVICHIHPDDPVPAIAFGGGHAGAPVVMVNQADHLFWLGPGNLSLLMSLRAPGAEAATTARGYPAENQLVVPTPLPGVHRAAKRAAARRALGLPESGPLALTLARPVKFAACPWHPGFVEVVGPALAATPQLVLAAVGPDPGDPAWRGLADRLPGRVLLPGLSPDPAPYLDAADIYLDSFPFASVTSMLEAAARQTPILASRMHRGMQGLIGSAGPLDGVALEAPDAGSYHAQLARLATDPDLRERAGRDAGELFQRHHGDAAWAASLERIYAGAAATPPLDRRLPSADPGELRAYAEALLGIEARTPLLWAIGFSREGFDRADRLSASLRSLAVRAAQKLSGVGPGTGPSAASYLIP